MHRTSTSTLRRTTGTRTLALGAAVGGLLLGLAGCSTDTATDLAPEPTTSATTSAAFNEADTAFASAMIPHHRQAVQMAAMAQRRDLSPAAARLADAIKRAQRPEIDQMTKWLESWGEPLPTPATGEMGEMGEMGGADGMADMDSMAGMMGPAEMCRLRDSRSDTVFERTWLVMMIEHHRGAVKMARTEVAEGADPRVVALAEQVIDDQTAEIATMRELLR